MARSFDGTNDNLTTPDNTVPGLDADDLSLSLYFRKANQPASSQIILFGMTATGGSPLWTLRAGPPSSAGYRLEWLYLFSGGSAQWRTDADLALNTTYAIAVTYNRASTANDPVFYVNGTTVAFTEVAAPSGTANTGGDTLRIGENQAGSGDLEGVVQHLWAQGGALLSAAAVNRAKWWGRPHGGAIVYYPFVTDKLTNEGSDTSATLTATGTTVVALPSPVVRPSSALIGAGVGW